MSFCVLRSNQNDIWFSCFWLGLDFSIVTISLVCPRKMSREFSNFLFDTSSTSLWPYTVYTSYTIYGDFTITLNDENNSPLLRVLTFTEDLQFAKFRLVRNFRKISSGFREVSRLTKSTKPRKLDTFSDHQVVSFGGWWLEMLVRHNRDYKW